MFFLPASSSWYTWDILRSGHPSLWIFSLKDLLSFLFCILLAIKIFSWYGLTFYLFQISLRRCLIWIQCMQILWNNCLIYLNIYEQGNFCHRGMKNYFKYMRRKYSWIIFYLSEKIVILTYNMKPHKAPTNLKICKLEKKKSW